MTRRALALVTPPAAEPVSLAEARAWLRIDGTDDDIVLTALIAAARSAAEEYLRRSMVTQTWRLALDASGPCRGDWTPGIYQLPVNYFDGDLPRTLPLPRGPVQSITSVVTYDTANAAATYAPANYRVDAADSRLILNGGAYWPTNLRTQGGTEITYVAGYGTSAQVPQPIRTGILMHVASLFEQRGQCDDAMDLPAGTKQLYAPYRVMGDARG